jgi:ABC-type sugar transport system ATPase subunit
MVVGIRAEHASLEDGSGDGVPGEVVLVESLGADSYVHASIEGTDSGFVARPTDMTRTVRVGTCGCRIHPERIFGFDAESGERLGGGAEAQTAPSASASARSSGERPRWK